ncbi:MAG: type II secretion system F family protein [Patescibacteria group bacterium]
MKKSNSSEQKKPLLKRIDNYLLQFSRVPLKEKLFFLQYFAIMIRAGLSLSVIMKTLARQTSHKRLKKILEEVGGNVEKGHSLTDSFKPHEDVFGELFINMIEAGENSGNLEGVLYQLYDQMKKKHALISQIRNALTYPAFIILVMIIVGVMMMVKVVPQLVSMLERFDTELPLATRLLIDISDFMSSNILFLLMFSTAMIVLLVYTYRTRRGKYIFQYMLLKTPVVKSIMIKINLARFSRTMSGLLKSDILVTRSFRITANVLNNLVYREAVSEMGRKVEKGYQINTLIPKYPSLFPPVVHEVVSVGEKTGELDGMLLELAEHYEEEVKNVMKNLPSIIEPVLIVLLGVVIGGMAMAIILPMYSLTSTI